jgi:hypothetical protein
MRGGTIWGMRLHPKRRRRSGLLSVGFRAVIVLELLAVAPGRAAPPPSSAESPTLNAAKDWLGALASGKADGLASRTRLPFSFTTTLEDKVKTCEGSVEDAEKLAVWLQCMRKTNKAIIKAAGKAKKAVIRIVETAEDRGQVHVFGELLPKIGAEERLVYAYLDGGPVTFLFTVVVVNSESGPTIRALLVTAEVKEG